MDTRDLAALVVDHLEGDSRREHRHDAKAAEIAVVGGLSAVVRLLGREVEERNRLPWPSNEPAASLATRRPRRRPRRKAVAW